MSTFGSAGIFGSSNPTQQQPGQSGGLFSGLGSSSSTNTGAGAAAAPSGTQPLLFGSQPNTTPGQNTGTGLFGGSNTGGGLFGSGSTATAAAQNQPTGGGLFGGTTQQSQPQPTPGTGGLFIGTTAATANAPQPQTNAGAVGGGLFGGAATGTQNQLPQTAGGGLFGGGTTTTPTGQAATMQGGGLFGSAPAAGQGTSGTGTGTTTPFGGQQAPQQQQQQQQPISGGLFGNTGASTTTLPVGSLFGSATAQQQQQQQPSAGGGLFGSSAAPTQQPLAPGGGLFGSSAPTTQQAPALGGGLFGGFSATTQQAPAPGGGLFGGSTATTQQGPRTGLLIAPAQNQADPQVQFAQLQHRIEAIVSSWNPNSTLNRFQHYFYNLVDPSQVHLYGRPANATDESLWQKAVRENPDPTCLVPKRVEAQAQQATAHQEKLKEIRVRIEKLSERHVLANAPRLQKLGSAQAQLSHRLLRLVQHLHLLIPALRSSSIRPEEEALRAALEEIDGEIRRPGGSGRIVGKLNELWALVGAVNAMRGANSKGNTDGVEWAVVDEDGLHQIVQILGEQQAGLTHLTKILQKALRDIGVIYGEEMGEESSSR
ncbi:nucleoporin complex subunit 54-domain-containing protein [Russula earlei]|uniref:Nucleoporin complex subunit 54-domain-containing protein n=1 Tax=Russula earlei TaxID=71964 RepID=A0ACC0UP73_9AGAM|nr:nucleoporin complex subunit 54-domain-containing protein [Russula earlei]